MVLEEILKTALAGVSANKIQQIIEEFFDNDKIIISITAWEHKYNYLVLKFNIWNDRKKNSITSIFLDDKVANKIYYPKEYPISPTGNFILLDPSFLEKYLSEYNHYYSQAFLLDEEPKSLSLVFFIPEVENIKSLELVVKTNKTQRFNIGELIAETPTIKEYIEARGHNIEKHLEILGINF